MVTAAIAMDKEDKASTDHQAASVLVDGISQELLQHQTRYHLPTQQRKVAIFHSMGAALAMHNHTNNLDKEVGYPNLYHQVDNTRLYTEEAHHSQYLH
jgi:hypothetical protein